jgi:hypothetical protein
VAEVEGSHTSASALSTARCAASNIPTTSQAAVQTLGPCYDGVLCLSVTISAPVADGKLNAFVASKLPAAVGVNIVPQLDASANANNADPKLYKAYALVTVVARNEIVAFLR